MAGESTNSEAGFNIPVRRVVLDPAAVRPAHRFGFAAVGDEVQLDIGHYDLPVFREVLERVKSGDETGPADMYVTGRYVVTPDAALTLLEAAQGIVAHYRRTGRLASGDESTEDSE